MLEIVACVFVCISPSHRINLTDSISTTYWFIAHQDLGDAQGSAIPIQNVSYKIMEKVKQYCEYHHQFPSPPSDPKKDDRRSEDIIPWDKEFCAALDQPTLFELMLVRALSYLVVPFCALFASSTLTAYTPIIGRKLLGD